MPYAISLAVVLSALWLLLSGYFEEPLLLGLGVASVVLVLIVAHRMQVIDREGHPIHLVFKALIYWPWLMKEIVLANIDVAKAILRYPVGVSPDVFEVTATQKSELGRVIYANSITLTPGTVTIALEDERLTVHALTEVAEDGLKTGEMDRRVSWLEGAK